MEPRAAGPSRRLRTDSDDVATARGERRRDDRLMIWGGGRLKCLPSHQTGASFRLGYGKTSTPQLSKVELASLLEVGLRFVLCLAVRHATWELRMTRNVREASIGGRLADNLNKVCSSASSHVLTSPR